MPVHLQAGQRVKGVYLGMFKVSGVITGLRPVYAPTDGAMVVDLQLDEEMTFFGDTRDTCQLVVREDGSPSSYKQYADRLEMLP